MHEVERDLDRKVAANRSRHRFEWVRRADQLSRRFDSTLSLEHHRDEGRARDELDQLSEERPLRMLAVVALGELAVHLHQLQRDDPKALALETCDQLAR